MNIAVQKITLSPSRDIPFNKLILSQANVRRVKAGMTIEELAASIARRGLLQSLNVRPVLDADGNETGMFEIPAGGRRYRALEMLVKQKRLSKTAPVPCVVSNRVSVILAEEDSLAENIERASLHPLDQFRAFQDMRQKGQSEEEIAAAFFVSVNVVKQRLRLAAVSPVLLDTYAEDGMTLEQLMAFTVSCDHARQEQVWETIQRSWSKEPYHIRRMMTENTSACSSSASRLTRRPAGQCCVTSFSPTMAAGLRMSHCSTDWPLPGCRPSQTRLPMKAGSGSRLPSTCPMTPTMACVSWPANPRISRPRSRPPSRHLRPNRRSLRRNIRTTTSFLKKSTNVSARSRLH